MFTKPKAVLRSDIKHNKESTRQKDVILNETIMDIHKNSRGHIVPGCSQIHKNSDNEKSTEDDLNMKKGSKWGRTKMKSMNEKDILMEKFESSLKERLLNSANFTKQVPIFDSFNKERIKLKTPVLIKNKGDNMDINNKESVYNGVFPSRRGKDTHGVINKELYSKYNKESQDWLQELQAGDQTKLNEARIQNKLTGQDEKQIFMSRLSNLRSAERDKNNHDVKRIDCFKTPPEHIKMENKNKQTKDKKNFNESKLRHSKKKSKDIEQNLDKDFGKSVKRLISKEEIDKSKNIITEKDQKRKRLVGIGDFNSRSSTRENKGIIKRESKEMHNQKTIIEVPVQGRDEYTMQNSRIWTHLNDDKRDMSQIFSHDDYRVMYFETEKDNQELSQGEINVKLDDEETTQIEKEDQNLRPSDHNELNREDQPSVALIEKNQNPSDINEMKLETEGEERPTIKDTSKKAVEEKPHPEKNGREEVSDEEEDCTIEPCNEPKWFEDYDLDREKRKLLKDLEPEESKEESSESEEYESKQEVKLEQKEKIVKKMVKKQTGEDVDIQAKMFLRDLVDTPEEIEEPKESMLKVVREIKTVPLVTIEEEIVQDYEEIKPEEIKFPKQMPMEYLQKNIGQYLVAGLAQVALFMPKDPVEYLAHWLIRERKKENILKEMEEMKAEIKTIRNNNLFHIRREKQMEYLRDDATKRYSEEKGDTMYPTFDSEGEIDTKVMDEMEDIGSLEEHNELVAKR